VGWWEFGAGKADEQSFTFCVIRFWLTGMTRNAGLGALREVNKN